MIRARVWGGFAALLVLSVPGLSNADELPDVLADAYRYNRAIDAERAAVRGKDELVPQASANLWHPHVTLSGGASGTEIDDVLKERLSGIGAQSQQQNRIIDDGLAQLDLAITMFDSGRTSSQLDYAEALIELEREILLNTEQQVFLSASQAYGQIVYAKLLQALATDQITDLGGIRDEAHKALEAHLVTITDTAQVDAQLASAHADFAQASGNLEAAISQLDAVIGRPPGEIGGFPELSGLPPSLDEAIEIALQENPQLLSAKAQLTANQAAVSQAESQNLPILSLVASGAKEFTGTRYTSAVPAELVPSSSFFSPLPNLAAVHPTTGEVGVKVTWPLYQGGGEFGAMRQQREGVEQASNTLDDTSRTVRATVRGYWANLAAARARVAATADQIKAARQSLEGTERQFHEGTSTLVDVIQLRLRLNTAIQSADQARYDVFIDTTQLLAAMGRFNARSLALAVTLYDPRDHYDRVHDKLFDFSDE
jgi:outer membrane protein